MTPTTLQTFATNYTAAWCSQNPAAVAAHFSPSGSLTINGSASTGRDAITAAAQSFMSAFPDMQVFMDNLILPDETDPTHATYHWTLTGTNTGPNGTGHRVRISGYEEWTLTPGPDPFIAESQGHFDAAAYQHQLQHGVEQPLSRLSLIRNHDVLHLFPPLPRSHPDITLQLHP